MKKWDELDWINFWIGVILVAIGALFMGLTIAVNYQKEVIKRQDKQIILLENYQDDLIDYYESIIEIKELEIYVEMLEEIHKLELENKDTVILKEYIEILAEYFELDKHEKADNFEKWLLDNYPYVYRYVININ